MFESFKIVSPFKATIFGAETDSQYIYNTLMYVYEAMYYNPDVFDENKINYKEFFEDLIYGLECNDVQHNLAQEDIEEAVSRCVRYVKKFEEIEFWTHETDYGFEEMNEKIKNGAYLIKNA